MLPRHWSRIIIVCRYVGLAAAITPVLLQADKTVMIGGLLLSGVLLFLTYYLMKTKLTCPNCGGDHYVPSWSGDALGHCRKCGLPWRFDDEE